MAERLDLGGVIGGTRQDNAFNPMLDEILQPGAAWAGFQGDTSKLSSRQPILGSMPDILSQGNSNLGISAWDSLFGPNGQVKDPMALLRSLNAGQVLSQRPQSLSGFYDKYGVNSGGNNGGPGYLSGGLGDNPWSFKGSFLGNTKRDGRESSVSSAFNTARQNNDPALVNWVRSMGWNDGRGFNQINFDPNNLRFGSFDLGNGVDLQNSNLDQLNQWSQDNYGVDLQRLAGSSNELLDTRKQWMADPSLWFNPNDPGAIQATAIPGLLDQDQALRLSQYADAYKTNQAQQGQQQYLGYQGLLDRALLGDSEYGRTAGGQNMLGPVSSTMGLAPPPAQTQDYSFLASQGLFQDQLQQALAQSGLGF